MVMRINFNSIVTESVQPIYCHIQAQNIDRGFAENAELPVLDVHSDKFCDFPFVKASGLGHPRHLVECGRRADMRIEPASRGGYQIHRNRQRIVRIGGPKRCNTLLYGLR